MTTPRRPPTSAEVAAAQRLLRDPRPLSRSQLASVASVLDAVVADRDHYRRAYEAAPAVAQANAFMTLEDMQVREGDGSDLTQEQLYGAPLEVEAPKPMRQVKRDFLRR